MSATATLNGTKIVRVRRERGRSGAYFATGVDIDGLIISADSEKELESLIPDAITQLYAACGLRVIVTRVQEPPEDHTDKWAATGADLAEQRLAYASA